MRKIDIHKKDLQDLLSKYLETLDEEPLIQYFIKHSNLPGRRGNLEMAGAFDALIREKFVENLVKIWDLSIKLTRNVTNIERTEKRRGSKWKFPSIYLLY